MASDPKESIPSHSRAKSDTLIPDTWELNADIGRIGVINSSWEEIFICINYLAVVVDNNAG